MKVVVDADQLIYACGFASEGEPRSHTFHLLNKGIEEILEATSSSTYEIYIGGKDNFREEVAVTQGYKANRVAPKPESYQDCREFLQSNWGAKAVDGMETDDVVSILLYKDFVEHKGDPDQCQVVLSSPDKDLKNTPGWHYNPQKKTLFFITEKQADRHFWWQTLVGDSTDNIKGLPYCSPVTRAKYKLSAASAKGCGAGSATKIMSATSTVEEAIKASIDSYVEWGACEGLTPKGVYEYWIEQCQLLWMVRELDEFDQPVMFSFNYDIFLEIANGLDDDCISSELDYEYMGIGS